jgi:anthranilate phosphoribosyltransferase
VKDLLRQIVAGRDLSRDDSRRAFEQIMSGQEQPALVAGLLAALAVKGETVDEIVGAALAMRERVTPVRCDPEAVDTCGTGGDGISAFNVSTTAAIIAAAAGVTVAKHGNRTNTRVSGSAEVLEALGVNVEADVPTVERCLQKARIGFLYARALHPAMRHAAPVRAALGIGTVFNLLGPLVNPAGVQRQVLGVARAEWTEKLAAVSAELGSRKVWVVHGSNGLCDLTVTGPTKVTELDGGVIRTFEVSPQQYGLSPGRLEDLRVASVAQSAEVVRAILAGDPGPCRNHALLNAGAAILVSGRVASLHDGVALAASTLDSGAAVATLESLIECSHGR